MAEDADDGGNDDGDDGDGEGGSQEEGRQEGRAEAGHRKLESRATKRSQRGSPERPLWGSSIRLANASISSNTASGKQADKKAGEMSVSAEDAALCGDRQG